MRSSVLNFVMQYTAFRAFMFITLFSLLNEIANGQDYCGVDSDSEFCGINDELTKRTKSRYQSKLHRRHLLYEVNIGEGFNLRRDVYLRMATLTKLLGEEWTLVLPPFGPLYHWKSNKFHKSRLPWKLFFDTASLNKTINVIEFEEYLADYGNNLDVVVGLKHFDDWNDDFDEKYEIEECDENKSYYKVTDDEVRGWFWSYFDDVTASKLICLRIEGFTTTLKNFILKELNFYDSIMIQNAEVVMHRHYGNKVYWQFRRSMRFNRDLVSIGDEFRELYLNSNDYIDNTEMEDNWIEMQRTHGDALGGHYLAIHLRREDFAKSRPNDVPTIDCAAKQIVVFAKKYDLDKVFIATDANHDEWSQLEDTLLESGFQVFRFENSTLLDGQIAIVDQWICAHAKIFIGTYESTFSFRIQEEREILGFDPKTTFNALCTNCDKLKELCKQQSQWKIVY